MTGMEYLNQLKNISVIIKQMEKEKMELESRLYTISAINTERQKVKSSHGNKPYSLVDKYIDKKTEVEKVIVEYIDIRNCIINQIQNLDNFKHIDILYKRYVEFKKFYNIADEMGYSNSSVMNIHSKAIKEFENKYTNDFRKLVVNYGKK